MSDVGRRDLLKAAALAGGAGLAGTMTGCVRGGAWRTPTDINSLAASLDPAAAQVVIDRVDQRFAWIDKQALPEELLPSSTLRGVSASKRASSEALVRKSIRSLYITGSFLDLPDEIKAHPGIQERLTTAQPDMDDSVSGMTTSLEKMSDGDHRGLQGFLRRDKRFGERLAMLIEGPAKEDKLPFKRRFTLRAGVMEIADRMATQSPALLTDKLVRKVRRLEKKSPEEQEQFLAARVGKRRYRAYQEKMETLHQAWLIRLGLNAQQIPASAPTSAPTSGPVIVQPTSAPLIVQPTNAPVIVPGQNAPVSAPPQYTQGPLPPQSPPTRTPGQRTLRTGGRIMGLGLASGAAGLASFGLSTIVATGTVASDILLGGALVLGVTVGPILLVSGLIVVIVGAIIRGGEE